ncbi:peptidase, partial [Priestia megaterium]
MNRVKIIAASLLAVLLLAFSDNFTSAAVQEAMIRVVHASPDA